MPVDVGWAQRNPLRRSIDSSSLGTTASNHSSASLFSPFLLFALISFLVASVELTDESSDEVSDEDDGVDDVVGDALPALAHGNQTAPSTSQTHSYAAGKAVDTPTLFRASRLSYDTSEQNISLEKCTSAMNRSAIGLSVGRIIYAAMNEWLIHTWYIKATPSTAPNAMFDGFWGFA
ncbi:hypothetical protein N7510_009168 [Penicillium lagena]|uniref:uncharacterized protein n=1 Tax=Penicillium lagena TaxID=94218 RepID=UPI002540F7E1|nr:uncharacterized protein N7510_009168 [Penicillium lagena]KAJ5606387.1 hypothetical protein N7510_009168 [Penicillium lagena]